LYSQPTGRCYSSRGKATFFVLMPLFKFESFLFLRKSFSGSVGYTGEFAPQSVRRAAIALPSSMGLD
ncbi:hypothetical protein FOZ63_024724, partial [Perkinsus olseni]